MKQIKQKLYFIATAIISLMLLAQTAFAQMPWPEWVAQLKQEAVSQGISPELFDSYFNNMTAPRQDVKGLNNSQPEHRLTYPEYLHTRASQDRIVIGQRKYQEYQNVLQSIQKKYGVDSCTIVALWGMETSYGNFMGSFPTVPALATLAYESNRTEMFRQELLGALHMLNNGDVTPQEFKGEWAGASGQCQFLPSSWYKYAVDYDRDGKKDIWKSVPDVLASIANYLRANGWEAGQPMMITVKLPANFDMQYQQNREMKTLSEWSALGVTQADGQALSDSSEKAFIVSPDGGPVWLATRNFKTILSYNNSIYYAGAIDYMANKICKK